MGQINLSILRGTFFVQPDVKISRFLSLSFDTRRPASSLTDHIFFPSSFFFFSPEYLCLATDDFFSTGGSKENLFYHGRADRYQASNRYFPFVRRPFEPPLLPRPSSKLILTISICDSLSAMPPPLHSFRSLSAKADRGTRADHNGG